GGELRRHRGEKSRRDADLRGRDGSPYENLALGANLRARLSRGGGGRGRCAQGLCCGGEKDDWFEAEDFQAGRQDARDLQGTLRALQTTARRLRHEGRRRKSLWRDEKAD